MRHVSCPKEFSRQLTSHSIQFVLVYLLAFVRGQVNCVAKVYKGVSGGNLRNNHDEVAARRLGHFTVIEQSAKLGNVCHYCMSVNKIKHYVKHARLLDV